MSTDRPASPPTETSRAASAGAADDGDPVALLEHDPAYRAAIGRALDDIVHSSLKPVATALTAIYAVLAVVQSQAERLILDLGGAEDLLALASALSAVIFLGIRWMLEKGRIEPRRADATVGFMGILVVANGLAQLSLTGQLAQSANLFVLLLAAGVIFLDLRWFAFVVVVTVLGWAGVVLGVLDAGTQQLLQYGAGLGGSVVISTGILLLRRRTFRRVEAFHLQDQLRQDTLEGALHRTERARRGEAEARGQLEEAVRDLKESEHRFRRLADASFEGVLLHRHGEIRDCNGRAAELFGTEMRALIGRSIHDFFRGENLDVSLGLVPAGEGGAPELVGVRTDGSEFPVETANTETRAGGQQLLVTVVRDVTRQREAARLLRAAAEAAEESNRAKSTFLANMSHELRTPLNAVIGFSNILRKNKDDSFSERDLEYLDRIVNNGKHLLALINDVLDLSKIEAGRMDVVIETVDLPTLIEELHRSFELQARRKGVDLVLDLPQPLDPIRGDGHRLKQILFNLVGNAMKFTDDGAVTIRVTTVPGSSEPRLLEVEDSGIGIPDHRIREIFAPFQQVDASTSRKYGGTGLGLAISRSLCEMMGFELSASSVEGEGSTFSIDLRPDEPVRARFQPGSVTVADEAN